MSKDSATETTTSELTPPVAVQPEPAPKRPAFSMEEYGSYVYAAIFAVVALGCFLITGW